jgi:hypothetical protein
MLPTFSLPNFYSKIFTTYPLGLTFSGSLPAGNNSAGHFIFLVN